MNANDCAFCIDGYLPAQPIPALGCLLRQCAACQDPCPSCHSQALFPPGIHCLACWFDQLAALNLAAALCPHCHGAVRISQRPKGVKPHAHAFHTCR